MDHPSDSKRLPNQHGGPVRQHDTRAGYASDLTPKCVTSLPTLPERFDHIAEDIGDTEQRGSTASVQETKLCALSKSYPLASPDILPRSLDANQERLRTFCALPEVADGGSSPIRRANGFEGDHSTVRSGWATSESAMTDEELPYSSLKTSPSADRSILHRPCCQARFKTPADLEDHILSHVQPYYCSFRNCTSGLLLFDCPLECINHEFEHHRVYYRWLCPYCLVSFVQEPALGNHLCQDHFLEATSGLWKELLERSKTKLTRPIEEVACDFCRTKSFPTRHDYAAHVGKHMEQITSRIALSIIPQKVEISGDFTELIRIWDYRNHEFVKAHAKIDTAANDNFLSRSIVLQRGIQTRKLLTDKPCIRTVDDVEVEISECAEPKWRTHNKNYRDTPFYIVEKIPLREQVILGQQFSSAQAPTYRTVFVLHNNGQNLNPEEQRHREMQSQDGKADEEKRQAAIRAERGQNREPAGPPSEPTIKNPRPNGTPIAR